MSYLVHTAQAQLLALWLSCCGWALTGVTLGLVQWRVWHVSEDATAAISSGVAWVGIWRVCFHSHTLVSPGLKVMFCQGIGLMDAFTPIEIAAAQVLMFLSLLAGFCGNAGAVYALRNVYFGLDQIAPIRSAFTAAGALCLSAAVMSLIPLVWNVSSVAINKTISFPPEFHMPMAPASQSVGAGIFTGMIAAVLMSVSGVTFLRYRLPVRSEGRSQSSTRGVGHLDVAQPSVVACWSHNGGALMGLKGIDNPVFQTAVNSQHRWTQRL